MDIQNLNLARKWRSKNFDQIVGQDLPVKMIKNSLYLNHFFPVYLFSGQKGCGKTSTARVFAAAINCDQLVEFQKNPRVASIPCLLCVSCQALSLGKHPDFIEIDAASNTGVDNVRQIIDSSALLPLMGRKKIYLIDEAHMLSKAAFNAFLKLMEEPPASVIFILATTDAQKIIDTVRSRCFQLFFKPVEETPLLQHLQAVCVSENIVCDDVALQLIIKETGGSIRDALNLLEQVRFAGDKITKGAVHQVLGHLDDERLLNLFEIILYKSAHDFLKFSQEHMLESFSAEFLWQKIIDLLRACIWLKNGVSPRHFVDYVAQLQFLSRGKSMRYFSSFLELLYSHEAMFRKTTAQYAFLEVILLRICQKNESNSNSSTPAMAVSATTSEVDELEALEDTEDEPDDVEDSAALHDTSHEALWVVLLEKIAAVQDPLLHSIFKQGSLQSFDAVAGKLMVAFPQELFFFNDILENAKAQWQPLIEAIFGHRVEAILSFTQPPKAAGSPSKIEAIPNQEKHISKPSSDMKIAQSSVGNYSKFPKSDKQSNMYREQINRAVNTESRIDISDGALWPQAHLLNKYFPGTFTHIRENA